MAPYAVQIIGALAQNFMRLFEEQEDEDDDDALAAMWVLQAISTMMEAVSDKPEVYPQMEAALLPMLRKMMGESAREYFEDVNEVAAPTSLARRRPVSPVRRRSPSPPLCRCSRT